MASVRRDQELITEELPDLIARNQMRHDASKEMTLSGELRRAVHSSGLLLPEIARKCGVSMLRLDEFLTGERTLPSDVLDRLADTLGCQLTKTP